MTASSGRTSLHVVRRSLNGCDRYYVYAWRGGPLIHKCDGTPPDITPALVRRAEGERRRGAIKRGTLDDIIDGYRDSPEFAAKADTTQREYKLRLSQISYRFGLVPIRLLESQKFRREILAWRDELAETPRAADRSVGMLSTVLGWAVDRGWIAQNLALNVSKLHRVSRADLIWEERHWKAVTDFDTPQHIMRVLRLGLLTGLRISDLLSLRWSDVQPGYIRVVTRKTGGEAIIPLHEDLARFLVGPPGPSTILVNSRGQPWTADGFQTSWQRARPPGFDRKIHDLRGTFATHLMSQGFSDMEIAVFMGWRAERIAAIRARYVDRERVARAMVERMAAGGRLGFNVKRP